jgi:hypothetical protein
MHLQHLIVLLSRCLLLVHIILGHRGYTHFQSSIYPVPNWYLSSIDSFHETAYHTVNSVDVYLSRSFVAFYVCPLGLNT